MYGLKINSMPRCMISNCSKFTRNKVTTLLYCPMHLARIQRHGYPEPKKDAYRCLEKLPHEFVDDFIKDNCSVMNDDFIVLALQEKGFHGATNWTVRYRRRKLGLKKYLSGDVLKHKAWIRVQAIKKYGHACELCRYRLVVDTHHLIPKYRGGSHTVDNLMIVCPNCHALITRGQIILRNRKDIPKNREFVLKKIKLAHQANFSRGISCI